MKAESFRPAFLGPRNRILAQLDAALWSRLSPQLELVQLNLRDVLYDIDERIESVYFVEDGIVSIVSAGLDGQAVETGTVGYEGMVGLPVFLGSDAMSAQAFCQVSGSAYRLSADLLRNELAPGSQLSALLGRYVLAFLTQTAQASACNRLHSMRQRCARWLLQTHDRVTGDTFDLTHGFLAQMLGVRRATVTDVASQLQRDGIIAYEYRRITVLDRPKLEAAACECYAIVRREFNRLVEGQSPPSVFAGRQTSMVGRSALGAPRSSVAAESM